MKIKAEFREYYGTQAWEEVVRYVVDKGEITTVSGIVLKTTFVGNCIFIKGGTPGTKRYDKGEYLTGKDFIRTYDSVREWEDINTGNVKPFIPRQQTPFIALLVCAGILE